jgi:hypothetical protein
MRLVTLFSTIFFPLAVRAGLQLDYADVPAACVETCRPVAELSGICDVDADFDDGNEAVEDLMKLQCICTNKSFDVAGATALCASCIDQKALASDRADNMDDIGEIMARCGFKNVTWTPEVAETAPAVVNVSVSASRLTASAQITTTVDFAPPPPPTSTGAEDGQGQKSNKHKWKHW